eukprot:3941443-Rhodomonas_salina.2
MAPVLMAEGFRLEFVGFGTIAARDMRGVQGARSQYGQHSGIWNAPVGNIRTPLPLDATRGDVWTSDSLEVMSGSTGTNTHQVQNTPQSRLIAADQRHISVPDIA